MKRSTENVDSSPSFGVKSFTGWQEGKSNRRLHQRPAKQTKSGGKAISRPRQRPKAKFDSEGFRLIDKVVSPKTTEITPVKPREAGPFRVLIAVHRPRYRGRVERAAALVGWEVVSLLNKQDVVGQVAKSAGHPDLLILSGDFGRQKDYAIFRAVQAWRKKGMILIGMVEDCDTAPESHPDSAPNQLSDVCLKPPYKMAELRDLFTKHYEEIRRQPAPAPKSAVSIEEIDED